MADELDWEWLRQEIDDLYAQYKPLPPNHFWLAHQPVSWQAFIDEMREKYNIIKPRRRDVLSDPFEVVVYDEVVYLEFQDGSRILVDMTTPIHDRVKAELAHPKMFKFVFDAENVIMSWQKANVSIESLARILGKGLHND